MTTELRNEIFFEHQNLIDITIRRNRRLLAALRLEDADVKQELSIKMLAAIDSFNPERCPVIEAYIMSQLQFCVLDLKRRHKPHGMTGLRSGVEPEYVYTDKTSESGIVFEIPVYDDDTIVYFSDFIENLTDYERETLNRKLEGEKPRQKKQTAALAYIRERLTRYYSEDEYERRNCA